MGVSNSNNINKLNNSKSHQVRGHHGRDRMVVGFPGFYTKTLIWHDGHLEFPIDKKTDFCSVLKLFLDAKDPGPICLKSNGRKSYFILTKAIVITRKGRSGCDRMVVL
jgi:hypothetical protein